MKQMSERAKQTVMQWIRLMQDGDVIRMEGDDFVISNSGGELDRIGKYEN